MYNSRCSDNAFGCDNTVRTWPRTSESSCRKRKFSADFLLFLRIKNISDFLYKQEFSSSVHFLCTDVIPCSRLRCYLFLVSYARSSPCPSRAGFIKNIIRNKRQYIRISVPLFQHRKKRPYNLYIRIFNFLQECRVFLDMFWLPYE